MNKLLLLMLLYLTGCSHSYAPLETVPHVDLEKYMGTWYEIASFPNSFQKDCTGTTAHYTLKPEGGVRVVNKCFIHKLDGEESIAKGFAEVVDEKTNSKLQVTFFWPFFGDYWIIDLDKDYTYAVVGHPNREYLWILNRKPVMDQIIYDQIINRIQAKGFDIQKLKKTMQ